MSHDFAAHKASLESVYECLGITCADVGELCDTGASGTGCIPYTASATSYDTSACVDASTTPATTTEDDKEGLDQTGGPYLSVRMPLRRGPRCGLTFYRRSEKYRQEAADHETMGIASNMKTEVDDSHSSHSRVPTSV